MLANKPRIVREQRTVELMVMTYCTHHHGGGQRLCSNCQALLDYARQRVERCPHGEMKPTCGQCRVHCYRPEMRQRIRHVMRFSGPRMLIQHPILLLAHIVDGLRSGQHQTAP